MKNIFRTNGILIVARNDILDTQDNFQPSGVNNGWNQGGGYFWVTWSRRRGSVVETPQKLVSKAEHRAAQGRNYTFYWVRPRWIGCQVSTRRSLKQGILLAGLTQKASKKPSKSPQEAFKKPLKSLQKAPKKPSKSLQKAPKKPSKSLQKASKKPSKSL